MAAPKLRFKEFGGDWSIKPLKNICKINQGLQIAIENRFTDDGENRYFYITNEFLREGAKNTYFIENPPRNVICDENDILMTRTGNTGQVVTDVKGAFHNNFFKIDFDRSIINKNFFIEFLKKDTTQHLILKYAGASTIPDLNHSDFYRIVMPITTIKEQTKIASFLSNVDEKISQLTQKHALLSQYKQGMMQKLFSQQIRFKADDGSKFGKWVNKKIIEIADYVDFRGKTPKKVDNGILLVTAKNIRFGYIDYEVSREYIGSDDFEEVMRRGCAKIGDVLITTEAPLGNVASVDREDIALAQRVIKYRGKEGILNNAFLKQKFLSEDFQALIASKATGGTVQGIKGSTLHNLEIYIPQDIEEQTKIANFLSSIDQKIEVVAQQIEQAKQWKKGLLQQMFV